MKIRITRRGVFRNGSQPLEIGTLLDVPDDFTGWPGKWERVKMAHLEVATPEPAPEPTPAPEPAPEHGDELTQLRAEYERLTGEKPHGRMKAETIRERIMLHSQNT